MIPSIARRLYFSLLVFGAVAIFFILRLVFLQFSPDAEYFRQQGETLTGN